MGEWEKFAEAFRVLSDNTGELEDNTAAGMAREIVRQRDEARAELETCKHKTIPDLRALHSIRMDKLKAKRDEANDRADKLAGRVAAVQEKHTEVERLYHEFISECVKLGRKLPSDEFLHDAIGEMRLMFDSPVEAVRVTVHEVLWAFRGKTLCPEPTAEEVIHDMGCKPGDTLLLVKVKP